MRKIAALSSLLLCYVPLVAEEQQLPETQIEDAFDVTCETVQYENLLLTYCISGQGQFIVTMCKPDLSGDLSCYF